MIRSGDAGFYQWAAFQWPTSDLLGAGGDDVLTFGCNEANGVMYDALALEITNTSANPSVTGWTDYTWVTGPNDNNDEFPNDAASLQPTEIIVPEPSSAALAIAGIVLAAVCCTRLRTYNSRSEAKTTRTSVTFFKSASLVNRT